MDFVFCIIDCTALAFLDHPQIIIGQRSLQVRMTKKRQIGKNIKNILRSNKSYNKKLIKDLQRNLKELEQLSVSVSGLETLSQPSIKKIHQRRNVALRKLRRLSMQINSYEKKISMLEKKGIK